VRTDNILILFAVLVCLAWKQRLPRSIAAVLAAFAIGIVLGINHWAGNYGWIVLFRFSFISGRYPAQIPHVLTIREYVYALVYGAVAVADRVAVWILLGLLAWRRRQDPLLIVVSFAVLAHFLLYPSPEDRYLVWAYVITGIVLIRSFDEQHRQTGVAALTHDDSVRLL